VPEESYVDDLYAVAIQAEEDIYQDLCYIDRHTIHVMCTLYICFNDCFA